MELLKGFRKRKNGSLEYRFVLDGERCSVYGQSVEECLKKEAEWRENAQLTGSADIRIENYFSYWLQLRVGTVRSATINTQRSQLESIARTEVCGLYFGDYELSEIELKTLRILQTQLYQHYCSNTVNQYMTLVKSVLKTAVQERRILYNPGDGLRRLRRSESEARETIHRALTEEETALFFQQAKGSRYYNLFLFLINTGCRCGEAAAITEKDVGGKLLQVNRTITRSDRGGIILGQEPKTSSGKRGIPLRLAAREALQAQIVQNRALHGGQNKSTKHPRCIFCSPDGALLSPSAVDAEMRQICKKAGISPFTTHAFRATFATRAIESGMNPKTLQEILGHSDFSLTMNLYCHCMEETKFREVDQIEIRI